MLGYKYNTEQEAQNAITQCDIHYNMPSPDGYTLKWCEYNFSQLDNFYYICYDETLEVVLGAPVEFEITKPTLEQ